MNGPYRFTIVNDPIVNLITGFIPQVSEGNATIGTNFLWQNTTAFMGCIVILLKMWEQVGGWLFFLVFDSILTKVELKSYTYNFRKTLTESTLVYFGRMVYYIG